MRPIIGITCPHSEETWGKTVDGGGFDYAGRAYAAAIYAAGGMPLLIPVAFEEADIDAYAEEVINRVNGLYFTGGGNRKAEAFPELPSLFEQQPRRSQWEALLLQKAYEKDMPCLGVCRGHQMMAMLFGGEMDTERFPTHKQAAPSDCGSHNITINPESKLASLVGNEDWFVNSIHVERVKKLPDGFIASAIADDGTLEAMEALDKTFFLSTQFHPELMPEEVRSKQLFKSFIEATKKEFII